MKNKTMKNLIALLSFAVLLVGARSVSAFYYGGATYGNTSYIDTNYYNQYNTNTNTNNTNPYTNTYPYQEPYTYVDPQPKVQYVYVPQTQVKYVPVETVKYVNTGSTTVNSGATSNQGASVVRATNTNQKVVARANTNTGSNLNTGQYVNYDGNDPLLASAYGAYNSQPVQIVDGNGVTALTVAGSGGFMPSSVFQWFLVILLILAIIIVARMISKSFSRSHAPVAH